LIPSPIRKALSTIQKHRVAHLLMGGQACVLYGAAEFSRDLDLALLPDPANLDRLQAALEELDAEVIAVPPMALKHLSEGLAVHFRCRQPEAAGLRIDVMTHMRGVAPFPELWARRTTLTFEDETPEVMALPDRPNGPGECSPGMRPQADSLGQLRPCAERTLRTVSICNVRRPLRGAGA
jgi:hypothetical protein